jgi:UDP-N-acetylglucosamine:LPS N-acetylglucosamine transferase
VRHRVLILTASVGEGHDLPARTLGAQLRRERPGIDVVTEDCLPAMGRLVAAVSAGAPSVVFYRFQWAWDLGFWFFVRFGPTRRLTQAAMTRLARPGILRLVGRVDPAVIVSVYPNATEVLGRLRSTRSIDVPVVAAITDLAAMHYWATRGADLHLLTHAESIAEVREVAGAGAAVEVVHGLTAPEFRLPQPQAAARRELGLPASGKVVLVSGGGWGVGDVEGAALVALELEDVACVVCLCGRNEGLRRRLLQRFGPSARVRVEGFTAQMPAWLAAGDVLVHSTGGLTILEAIMLGCPAISYGFGHGHVRSNNDAYRRLGLADVASSRRDLAAAIKRALEQGRRRPNGFSELPSAASCVLALLDGGARCDGR